MSTGCLGIRLWSNESSGIDSTLRIAVAGKLRLPSRKSWNKASRKHHKADVPGQGHMDSTLVRCRDLRYCHTKPLPGNWPP